MLVDKLIPMALAGVLAYGMLLLALSSRWARRIALDVPNERSLHSKPVPRIGGLILVPTALLTAYVTSQRFDDVLSVLAAVLCAISFLDDRRGLSIRIRLLFHIFAASILCYVYGRNSAWELLVGVMGLVWAINLYNFMDGADGLAGEMALVGFSVYGLALYDAQPNLSVLAFSVAGAAAGFLILNSSPARVFMGDAGSVPLGFLAGGIGIEGWLRDAWPVWFPFLVFAPFFLDTTATLLRRMARREKFWAAHREHYYQRLVRMGWSHRDLAQAELGLMLACAAIAMLVRQASTAVQFWGIALCLASHAVLMFSIDRRWATFGADT